MEEQKICKHCGKTVELSDGEYFDDKFYCSHCIDELTIVCENFGERVLRVNSVEEKICQTCYVEDSPITNRNIRAMQFCVGDTAD